MAGTCLLVLGLVPRIIAGIQQTSQVFKTCEVFAIFPRDWFSCGGTTILMEAQYHALAVYKLYNSPYLDFRYVR